MKRGTAELGKSLSWWQQEHAHIRRYHAALHSAGLVPENRSLQRHSTIIRGRICFSNTVVLHSRPAEDGCVYNADVCGHRKGSRSARCGVGGGEEAHLVGEGGVQVLEDGG